MMLRGVVTRGYTTGRPATHEVLRLLPPASGAVWEKIVQQAAHIGQVWDMTDLKADVEEMQVPSRGLVAAMGQTLAAIGQSLAPEVS